MSYFKNLLANAKSGLVVACATVATVGAQAAVSYDEATSKFTGDIDMSAYYSGVTIAIAVVGTVIATTLVFKALNKAR